MPSCKHASTYENELATLEAALEAEGFRHFKEMGPQYRQVDQQGPTKRRATRPTLVTSQRRATPLAAITAGPQVRGVEPIRNPGLKTKYLGLISTRRPLTVSDSPPTTPEIQREGATLALTDRRRPVPIIDAPLVEPGSRAGYPNQQGHPNQRGSLNRQGRTDQQGRPNQQDRPNQQGRLNRQGRPNQQDTLQSSQQTGPLFGFQLA